MCTTTLLGMFGLAVPGCRGFTSEEEEHHRRPRVNAACQVVLSPAERSALGLKTANAERGTVNVSRIRFGKVVARPDDDVRLVTPVQARVVKVVVSLGQPVATGDVIATLAPNVDAVAQANMTARLTELRAQISGHRARVRAAEAEFKHVSRLTESRLATPSRRAKTKAALQWERALVAGLERSAQTLRRFATGRIDIKAPSSGTIVQIETSVGRLLAQGQMVARIVRPGVRWIDLSVPPDDTPGDAYRIDVDRGHIPARFVARGRLVTNGMRTDRIEVESSPPTLPLAPGRMVAVEVRQELSGIVVPLTAIVRRRRGRVVFVEVHPGLYQPHQVKLAGTDPSRAVLTNGDFAGKRIVAQGAVELLGEMGFSGRPCNKDATLGMLTADGEPKQ